MIHDCLSLKKEEEMIKTGDRASTFWRKSSRRSILSPKKKFLRRSRLPFPGSLLPDPVAPLSAADRLFPPIALRSGIRFWEKIFHPVDREPTDPPSSASGRRQRGNAPRWPALQGRGKAEGLSLPCGPRSGPDAGGIESRPPTRSAWSAGIGPGSL